MKIVEGDLSLPAHATALVQLMDLYAHDPMGGGRGLDEEVQRQLPTALRARNDHRLVLAFDDEQPIGLINAFEGFSTFKARPLLNIHDVIVHPRWRRRGVAQKMLETIEKIARRDGCCKLTLEVLEGNRAARALYHRFGFRPYCLDPATGYALFEEKLLDQPDNDND